MSRSPSRSMSDPIPPTMTRRRGMSAPPTVAFREETSDAAASDITDSKQTPFIQKTYAMIDTHKTICWLPCGQGFLVKDANVLAAEVLPKFFKHGNFASFVRQLHFYGFSKTTLMNGGSEFRHPNFIYGRMDLLHLISRKSTDTITKQRSQIDDLQQQVMYLRQQNEQLLMEHRRIMSLVASKDHSALNIGPQMQPQIPYRNEGVVPDRTSSGGIPVPAAPSGFTTHPNISNREGTVASSSPILKPLPKALCFNGNNTNMMHMPQSPSMHGMANLAASRIPTAMVYHNPEFSLNGSYPQRVQYVDMAPPHAHVEIPAAVSAFKMSQQANMRFEWQANNPAAVGQTSFPIPVDQRVAFNPLPRLNTAGSMPMSDVRSGTT